MRSDILAAAESAMAESALLIAIGHQAAWGRPNAVLLNHLLERKGLGRPIREPKVGLTVDGPILPDDWAASVADALGMPHDTPITLLIEPVAAATLPPLPLRT